MATISYQNNFGTNLTSGTTAGATTSPINSIPTVDAPYYIAFDATNINAHYEVVLVTSDTATNVNHAATTYDHTTAEEVRMVIPAAAMNNLATLSTQTAGTWIDWVPTWTGLTKGSAAIVAKYTQIGKTVHFRLALVFAADTSISGSVSFTLPVTSVTYSGTAGIVTIGNASYYDAGTTLSNGSCNWKSTADAYLYVDLSSGTYASPTVLSSTIPMTWTTNDEIHITGTYEAA